MSPVLPPATVGILGGGQLGRMTAIAARSLGYRVHVLDPDPHCAASAVVERVVAAPFDSIEGAVELARSCDVVTVEIEQLAPPALDAVAATVPLRPGAHVLRMVQDRERQKRWLQEIGAPIGPFRVVTSAGELGTAMTDLGGPLFVKACQGGYDGRSQLRVAPTDDLAAAMGELGGRRAVAESALDLRLELSVLVARRPSGDCVVYPPAMNHHENQVLAWSSLPGVLPDEVSRDARALALRIAEEIALEGILAVEMFLLRDGRLLVNELAPRPHNSYHASELACPTSQFEQLVRAACDLPLGAAEPARPAAIVNLFGELWLRERPPDVAAVLADPRVRLVLYGKTPRAGRKMGHVAALGNSEEDAVSRARAAAARA